MSSTDLGMMRRVMTREGFLTLFTLGVGGLAGLVVAIPIVGFVLSPLLRPAPEAWIDLGPVDNYQIGQTQKVAYQSNADVPWAGTTATQAVWLRRLGPSQFAAIAVYCTHLGCPVHYLAKPKIFLCPCHGGVYNYEGIPIGGPPPRPLFRYQTQIKGGHIYIKTHPLPVVT